MANTCIFCGKPEDLNTSMTIQVDEGKVKVDICDGCAEEATLKKAREAYQKKMEAIKDILAQARALGFDLQPNTPGQKIEVIQQTKQFRQQQVQQPIQQVSQVLPEGISPLIDDEEGPVISTASIMKPMQSVGGAAHLGSISANVPSHRSHSLNELGSEVLLGKAKVTLVEGRGGMPLQLPSYIQDGTGTTRLRVGQRMDDAVLQRRFKSLGHESRWDRGSDFRSGYEQDAERQCPICRGSGRARSMGKDVLCPKCHGTGIIITTQV